MRLDEFGEEDQEPDKFIESDRNSIELRRDLEKAKLALHREFLRVDTLLRNMPDSK